MQEKTIVKASFTATINLGDFNNVKIEFGVEDWVRDGEKAGEALTRISNLIEEKLAERAKVYQDG